jgi:hypothetical protein
MYVPSFLYQDLIFWLLDGSTKIVNVNDKPFMVNLGMIDPWLYNDDAGPI